MKNIILIMLINLAVIADIKVTTLEIKSVNYENGAWVATTFRIVYKWIQMDSIWFCEYNYFISNVYRS